MTFSTDVPNAGQSPGVFPTQNNTNFTRLQTLFAAEHQFNNTAQVTDGVHLQVTLIARADPVSLPAGTNGMLYCKVVSGVPQLRYFDGTNPNIIFPSQAPTKATGTQSLSANTLGSPVFTIPDNSQGTILVNYQGVNSSFSYYVFYKLTGLAAQGYVITSTSDSARPTAFFGLDVTPGVNLQIKNNSSSTRVLNYFIIYESIP